MTGKVQNIHAVAADFCRGWKDEKGKVTFEEEDNWKQVKTMKGKVKKLNERKVQNNDADDFCREWKNEKGK